MSSPGYHSYRVRTTYGMYIFFGAKGTIEDVMRTARSSTSYPILGSLSRFNGKRYVPLYPKMAFPKTRALLRQVAHQSTTISPFLKECMRLRVQRMYEKEVGQTTLQRLGISTIRKIVGS